MPLLTQPLAKSVRTGEGILVYATNVVLAVAAVLPHGLNWTHAGAYLAVLNGVHVLSRALLKIAAVQRGLGIGPPVDFDPVDPTVIASVIAGAEGVPVGVPVITATTGKLDSAVKPDGGDAGQDGGVTFGASPPESAPKPD